MTSTFYDSNPANFQVAPTSAIVEQATVTDRTIQNLITVIPQNVLPTAATITLLNPLSSNIRIKVGSVAAPYSLNSMVPKADGTMVRITNNSGAVLTVVNEALAVVDPAARITTSTGANVLVASNASVLFTYDLSVQRWRQI
jgi:hypothetical protein